MLIKVVLIKQIVDYVKEINSDNYYVVYSTITNGTLFNDEMVEFFKKNNFVVTVSLDGTKEAHDSVRKFKNGEGSFDVIANNLLKYGKEIPIKCRLTINDMNTNVEDAIMQIRKSGIQKIIIGVDTGISDNAFDEFMQHYNNLMEIYYNDIKRGDFYCIENVTCNLEKIITRRRVSSRCNAGRAYFTISADKKVYDCHRLVGTKEGFVCDLNSQMSEEIEKYIEKMDKTIGQDVGTRISSCRECSFKYLCGGMCYQHAYIKNGKRFSKISRVCCMTQYEIKTTLNIITSLELEERRKFISYIMEM